ncbi:phospholipase D-like domain-containing protein [Burkholderia seminalis]|uniref:phospholipase D-like domain-containing protein n=1 Tax=Burkholderia seminalis TaxID=488731 RepID=UPI001452D172|nr:phospholipase D-like domain-containing protein [Burkholderia seminalis]MBJ9591617.1 phosphatidylserine/phosphatidylglycerophosphate/cardiolipin synthase family protein [Burkholderia seminalis]MCA8432165.1 phospholipase D-like domain-containing protein [Burkholderia seminalis]VWB55968.1 phospholipase D/transphosphatidylase [Burkholderia seminalis]
MTAKTITTPMALNQTSSASVCSPWFVDTTDEGKPVEFHPITCSYQPLVNGQEAFGAVYDAIMAARYSVDIICWGFQPSMYFKRGDGGASLNIGDLLLKKGLEGVRVRLLCWADSLNVAQVTENSTPGFSWLRNRVLQNENDAEREYDRAWYLTARAVPPSPFREEQANKQAADLRAKHAAGLPPPEPSKKTVALQGLPCIEVATRDFSLGDRAEIIYRESRFREDKNLNEEAVTFGFGTEPSHHQKMVLVDYEAPEHAVGFVMGHNTLDAYWDDDKHSFARMHPRFGRNGATPRQDMSALVTGPILEHLNVNFCNAWKRSTDVDLLPARRALASRLRLRKDKGTPVMAQILRTQSQEGRRDIRAMYKQATDNACRYIYIENQYFRWPPLVDHIKTAINRQTAGGRDIGKHGPLYLFVVTNSSDDALDHGQVSTYRMMESLGHADTMPNVTRLERNDVYQQQRRNLAASIDGTDSTAQLIQTYGTGSKAEIAKALEKNEAHKKDLQKQLNDVNAKIADNNKGQLIPGDIPGLKTLICTLVAPDSPAGNWMDTYVHSKIMVIDDVFLTHGSANINTRSMEVDSELNICHEHGDVTKALRKHLWTIHTRFTSANSQGGSADTNRARAIGDDMGIAYDTWKMIITSNQKLQNSKKQSPTASIISFQTATTTRSRLD